MSSAPALTDPVSLPLLSRLAQQDRAAASSAELLDGLEAWQRTTGFVVSRMWLQMAELHARFTGPARTRLDAALAAADKTAGEAAADAVDLAERSVCAEIGAALSWSTTRTQGQLEVALILTIDLTATLDAVAAGQLEVGKAEVLARALRRESAGLRRRVEAEVLGEAAVWTVPELRDRIKKALLRAAPELAAKRVEAARRGRRVWFRSEPDDMVRLEAVMSALDGVRVQAALDHAALGIKAAQTAADNRGLDAIRCDLLADTLIALGRSSSGDARPEAGHGNATSTSAAGPAAGSAGSHPGGSHPGGGHPGGGHPGGDGPGSMPADRARRVKRALREEVVLTVSLETMTGNADEPGYLTRYGPVSAHTARLIAEEIARDGYWRCAVTDGVHGTLLGLGRSTYTPHYKAPEYLQRFVNLRDRFCDFPTCRVPAAACDFEHTVSHPVGSTCECGGAKRCRSHHRLKHETPWSVKRSGDPTHPPGTHVWTSPTGREYTTSPATVGVPGIRGSRPDGTGTGAVDDSGAAKGDEQPGVQPRDATAPGGRLWAYDPALAELPVPNGLPRKKHQRDPGPPPF